MLYGNMNDHLQKIIQKIINQEHFGIIRPSDGEFAILENNTLTVQRGDDWTFMKDDILREQLIESVKINKPNLFIGIPCNKCCIKNMCDNYLNKYNVAKNQLTYANLFCNSNWITFINFLKSYDKGFYLITTGTKECEFPIKERLFIDKFLVNNWNTVFEKETFRIIEFIKDKKNKLICFASGPLSKIWIPKCMEINPENIYLDIGSALDYFTKGTENARPYTYDDSLRNACCNFI